MTKETVSDFLKAESQAVKREKKEFCRVNAVQYFNRLKFNRINLFAFFAYSWYNNKSINTINGGEIK